MDCFKNNIKFQEIVSAAKTLFWKYGIKRVSIEEICTSAPVSKMTFYKFFKNKEVLAEYVLKEILTQWHNNYISIMNQNIDFSQKIKQVIALEQHASENMGEEFIQDIYKNEYLKLQELISKERNRYHAEIVKDMIDAQKKGEIRKDIKPEFILYLLEDIANKVVDKNLSKLYSSKQELIMELTNYFFYGIMNNNQLI
ncbi:MAG: TetR/AcrR family transcriptional regulator [Bacteroidales bacterium]|nr:TetR/AcrR family transcriptional regulator [Bacteroidales bacterium]